ncbi:MAG: hypothetical protein R3C53_28690 [Pirellulaceae bacterium]
MEKINRPSSVTGTVRQERAYVGFSVGFELTESVDPEKEAAILKTLESLRHGRTCLARATVSPQIRWRFDRLEQTKFHAAPG